MAGLKQSKQRCFVFILFPQLKSNLRELEKVDQRSKYLIDNYFSSRKKKSSE